ncbi:hypothetical protein [Sulfurimonas lithotrophica]|uniref:hypothetical protein n=1 Tax=Sulfurimonas lithotrophica TaxID=2590022 RepID=UPI00165F62DC|nr:hypothetical protein [Sulfurimonas lithotrophica]
MSNYKKYVYIFSLLFLFSIGFHLTVWNVISKKVLLTDKQIYRGDLGRTSFKVDSINSRPSYLVKEARNLPKKHIVYKDLKPRETVDVITIGDSFANAATQGINPYFQDYIATYNDFKVLNILPHFGNFIETIAVFYNSGLLDELSPKAIVIESVERFCIPRFISKLDLSKNIDKSRLKKILAKGINFYQTKDPYISFINSQNFRAASFNIQRVYNNYGNYKFAILSPMKRDYFSTKDSNTLLFHREDIENNYLITNENIQSLNNNFNKLANKLKNKGIKLYFMPAVDKYNLYEPYIENNSYPKSQFFEILRGLPKEYELIDTKAILSQELKKGVKDLYYADDTHWSYKASEAIFKKVKFE